MNKFMNVVFLFCSIFILKSCGSPGIGFSATLNDDVIVARNNWTTIAGWKSKDSLLIFEYGMILDETQSATRIPFDGLYFASANILINTASRNTIIQACISSKCQTSDQKEKTITISFITYFKKNRNISFKLHGNSIFTVMHKSSFAMAYLGPMATTSALLAVLDRNTTVQLNGRSNNVVIMGWKSERNEYAKNGYKKGWFSKDGAVSVSCPGVYLMSTTMKLKAPKGEYQVKFILNSNQTLSKHYVTFKHDGVTTVSQFQRLQLEAKDTLAIVMTGDNSNIEILQYSSLNLVFIDKISENMSDYSIPFRKKKSFRGMKHVLKNDIYDIPDELSSGTDDNQIALPKHGIYIFTLHFYLNMTMGDEVTIRISVWTEGIQAIKREDNRLMSTDDKMVVSSVLLTGVFSVGNTDFLRVTLESKKGAYFEILPNSRMSFTVARSHSLAAGFTFAGAKVNKNTRTKLALNSLPYQAFRLNSFLNQKKDHFRVPLRGFYLILVNLMISSKDPKFKDFSMRIIKDDAVVSRNKKRRTELFSGNFTATKQTFCFNPSGFYLLNANDLLSFQISSRVSCSVSEISSMFLFLMDYPESGHSFIARMPSNATHAKSTPQGLDAGKNWTPETRGSIFYDEIEKEITLKKGIYFISCNLQLELSFAVDVKSLEALLFVYFDGKDMNFGLKDMVEIQGSKNDSKIILLSVNGIVNLKDSRNLKTIVKLTAKGVGAKFLRGDLSVTRCSTGNGNEMFRHVQASTKLLSMDGNNWKYIGENIQNEKDGEFKTNNVEFVGPHFLAKQPIVAYVSATTMIHGIGGQLDYGMVVLLASDSAKKSGLTIETYAESKTSATLKWSGLVYLEPWKQLSLAIKMREGSSLNTDAGRSRWSSLSFFALPMPVSDVEPEPHLLKANESSGAITRSGLYLSQPHAQKIHRLKGHPPKSIDWLQKGHKIKLQSENTVTVPTSNFRYVWDQKKSSSQLLEGKSVYHLDEIFDKISSTGHTAPFQKHEKCIVGILSIKLVISTVSNATGMSLISHAVRKQLTLSTVPKANPKGLSILQLSGVFCFRHLREFSIINQQNTTFNLTILPPSSFLFAVLNSAGFMEGFSALQISRQTLRLLPARFNRLDGWNTESKLSFDETVGFRPPFGSYLVVSPGKYLISSTIVLQAKYRSKFKLGLFLDGSMISHDSFHHHPSSSSITTLKISLMVNIENSQQLELKLHSKKLLEAAILPGSSFSIVMLDLGLSLGQCYPSALEVRTVSDATKAYRIGKDVTIPCETKQSRIVDFHWFQNGKVVRVISSSTRGDLVLRNARASHSGTYYCKVHIGDYSASSHHINIIVYDPTPNVTTDASSISFPENSLPNMKILNIQVKAATSLGTNDANVLLSISPDNLRSLFHIEPRETSSSAILKTSATFDHEACNYYNLTLIAKNLNYTGLSQSLTQVSINIIDRNDNPPLIKHQRHALEIYRDISIGTFIYEITATDRDTGENALIIFSFHNNSDAKFFSINHRSGIIRLKRTLIAETESDYVLFVIAENGKFRVFTQISIKVREVNANRPYFDPEVYHVNVTEDIPIGSVLTRVGAVDLDEKQGRSELTFKIIDSTVKHSISVDRYGIVQTTEGLSKYAGTPVIVKIMARDGGGLNSTNIATVHIDISKLKTGLFSSSLRFESDIYRVKLNEDVSIGSFVIAVKALFPMKISYMLRYVLLQSEDSGNFSISESSGHVYTNSLFDYETVEKYQLTVFACDIEEKVDCVAAKVAIQITDVNDHIPQFPKSFYNVTVPLNTPIGTEILKLHAVDKDSGLFGLVNYDIENKKWLPFSVESSNGTVKLSKALSENQAKFVFVINAYNADKNSEKTFCLIQVNVGGGNDRFNIANSISFSEDMSVVSIPEDKDLSQHIMNITAFTQKKQKIKYSLVGNDNKTFYVEENTGALMLLKKLDFERKRNYDIFLLATSATNDAARSFTKIIVEVIDINDNRPNFVNKNNYTLVHKGTTPGTLVTVLKAFDADSGSNGRISYKLRTDEEAFVINTNTGRLEIKNAAPNRSYELVIEACDTGTPSLCSNTSMTVRIIAGDKDDVLKSVHLSSNSTSIKLQFDVGKFIMDSFENIAVRFIAQEKHDKHSEYESYTQLPALTWYDINSRRSQHNNFLRRYVAAEIPEFALRRRISKRSLGEVKNTRLTFTFGKEKDCDKVWRRSSICNGPLRPSLEYRFQMAIKYQGSDNFVATGFTRSYKIGSDGVVENVVASSRLGVAYWIALIVVSAFLFVVLFNLAVCWCVFRIRKRRKAKGRYEVGIQKNSSPDDYFLPGPTETESQEFTVWFSEESVCNGRKSSLAKKSSNV